MNKIVKESEPINVSLERVGDAFDRLPSTHPAEIETLMLAIDRKVQSEIHELLPSLAEQIEQHAALIMLSDDELAMRAGLKKEKVCKFLAKRIFLDLPEIARLCSAVNGTLRLSLVWRNNTLLECDKHLTSQTALEGYLKANLGSFDLHALPRMFFLTCGLRHVHGLDGGYLERSCPIMFRLLRHLVFMRARLSLRVSFDS